MAIVHGLDDIIRDLDVLQQSRLPDACRRALYETGPHMREFHRREMASVFRDPTDYTLRSVRYRIDPEQLSMTLSISQDGTLGQTPADYLGRVVRVSSSSRAPAITTRFARQLQRAGQISPGTFLVPNLRAKLAQTRRGRMSPQIYQTALSQLRGNIYAPRQPKTGERYFAVDTTSSSPLKPGVYRAKFGSISQLFTLLDQPPSVPRTYNWTDASIDEAIDQLEGRIMKHLRWPQ